MESPDQTSREPSAMQLPERQIPSRSRPRRFGAVILCVALLAGPALGVWRTSQLYRTSPDRAFQEGLAAIRRGDPAAVMAAAEMLPPGSPWGPHRALFDGYVLLRRGRPGPAIDVLAAAKDHAATRKWALCTAGEALYQLDRLGEAVGVLRQAVEMDPKLTDAHRWLAACFYDLGAMNQATHHLQIVAEQDPADARSLRLLGLMFHDFEEWPRAVDAYRESLRRDPGQEAASEIRFELAECLMRQREFKEALETLEALPPSAEVAALRAECHDGLQDAAAAEEQIEAALQQDPANIRALQLKAQRRLNDARYAEAVQTLETAVRHHPTQWRLRFYLVQAYERLGDREAAQRELKMMQEWRKLHDRFAELHMEAIKKPFDAAVRLELAQIAEKIDRPMLALSWYRATLGLDSGNETAKQAILRLEGEVIGEAAPAAPLREADTTSQTGDTAPPVP
ncbi:MAG: tetratricopeptide repeat protein [Thermogutta sp.]